MKLRSMVSVVTVGLLALGSSVVVSAPAHADDPAVAGSYQSVAPTRVLDTRGNAAAGRGSVQPLSTVTFAIPKSISPTIGAVVLEVTVVNPTAPGYVTVYSSGGPRPVVSNVNFQAGRNVPNTVVVRLTGDYNVSIYNGSKGTVDLLADVQGYFQAGQNAGDAGTFVPVTPARYLDTRSGSGTTAKGKVAAHSSTRLRIGGVGSVPDTAAAVALNLTAVGSGGNGYLKVFPGTIGAEVSTVNFHARQDRANLTFVGLDGDGDVTVYNGSPFTLDVLADVTGYITPSIDPTKTVVAGAFGAISERALDTRKQGTGSGYVPALATLKVPIFDTSTPAGAELVAELRALSVNVTAVNPKAAGFFTTWDGSTAVPAVSNVNFVAGQDSAGSIVVPLNPDGSISVYNGSFGNVDMLVDLTGAITSVAIQPDRLQALVRSALQSPRQATVIAKR